MPAREAAKSASIVNDALSLLDLPHGTAKFQDSIILERSCVAYASARPLASTS